MNQTMSRGLFLFACSCVLTALGCSGVSDAPLSNGAADAAAEQERPPFIPTVPRAPTPSKSLTMSPDWQPPSPTRTGPARLRARVQPTRQYGVPTRALASLPSDAELHTLGRFAEPLRPVIGTSSEAETKALAEAIGDVSLKDERSIDSIERFVETHPSSRWAPSLHLNMGAVSYRTGYFQDALAHWKAAWELAKDGEDPAATEIANQALAEYAKMSARIGRTAEVETLLKDAQKRNLMGDARVTITSAAEGLWTMHHRPGISFMCGPYALLSVAEQRSRELATRAARLVERVESPPTGFSLGEVHRMSTELASSCRWQSGSLVRP